MSVRIDSPYGEDGEWFRGNLHTHTDASPDAAWSLETVVAVYADRGYDFVVVTDHDVATPVETVDDVTLLPGIEVTANGTHVVCLGTDDVVSPHADRQRVLDEATAAGGIGILPHPNWGPDYAHYSQSALEALDGYAGIEIYNGASRDGRGRPAATDRWDRLLSAGRVVWGYAADDAHADDDVGAAWTVVQAPTATPMAILDALRAGRCHASTGVAIEAITVEAGSVTVETADAEAIQLVADYSAIQQTVTGSTATFHLPADLDMDASYVRIVCHGTGEQTAWTQPLFLDGRRG